jgi:hypothetical protein
MLWAWERPCDLSWIETKETGVAFLAETIVISPDHVVAKPRLQPLKVPPGTYLQAVVRIEVERREPVQLTCRHIDKLSAIISGIARRQSVSAIQIDFDARQSDRDFYRQLLSRVREEIPNGKKLAITALASWLTGDAWLDGIDVDEITPMFFRMGQDSKSVMTYLRSGRKLKTFGKSLSVGLCTDEKNVIGEFARGKARRELTGRTVYLFSPSPEGWSRSEFDNVVKESFDEA